ncbi:MAG: lytic transglycosylase domain-containing protein [Deltaproteobacteria bacterium]|nr:lytic transglycosylase domain-containing protein [Deltaproteobacteria bacterium]
MKRELGFRGPEYSPWYAHHFTPEEIKPIVTSFEREHSEVPMLPKPKLVLTPEVTRQIKKFSENNRVFIERSVERREEFYPEFAALFIREGVPLELLNVALIESGFKSNAVSVSGATGVWQFMKPTGRSYGLKINWLSDERKDPIRSTWAAARHLKDLYEMFGDWYLALAAYNAGQGAIRRAIERSGTRDFWQLARKGYIRKQTADYVPKFIAATIITENLHDYGFIELAKLYAKTSTLPG